MEYVSDKWATYPWYQSCSYVPHTSVTSSDDRTRPLVLIVEDDWESRYLYCAYLSTTGFDVIEARDGFEAIDKAREHHPDIIVTDLAMPRLDGREAIRRLKADPRTRDIPIIAITAFGRSGQAREEARTSGCEGYLAKPCLPEVLEMEIRLLLHSIQPPVRRGSDPPPPAPLCPSCRQSLNLYGQRWENGRIDYFICPNCERDYCRSEGTGLVELPHRK